MSLKRCNLQQVIHDGEPQIVKDVFTFKCHLFSAHVAVYTSFFHADFCHDTFCNFGMRSVIQREGVNKLCGGRGIYFLLLGGTLCSDCTLTR